MQVGNSPVDPAYKAVTQHRKWVIPWMEDDPGLTAPEIWVGRDSHIFIFPLWPRLSFSPPFSFAVVCQHTDV